MLAKSKTDSVAEIVDSADFKDLIDNVIIIINKKKEADLIYTPVSKSDKAPSGMAYLSRALDDARKDSVDIIINLSEKASTEIKQLVDTGNFDDADAQMQVMNKLLAVSNQIIKSGPRHKKITAAHKEAGDYLKGKFPGAPSLADTTSTAASAAASRAGSRSASPEPVIDPESKEGLLANAKVEDTEVSRGVADSDLGQCLGSWEILVVINAKIQALANGSSEAADIAAMLLRAATATLDEAAKEAISKLDEIRQAIISVDKSTADSLIVKIEYAVATARKIDTSSLQAAAAENNLTQAQNEIDTAFPAAVGGVVDAAKITDLVAKADAQKAAADAEKVTLAELAAAAGALKNIIAELTAADSTSPDVANVTAVADGVVQKCFAKALADAKAAGQLAVFFYYVSTREASDREIAKFEAIKALCSAIDNSAATVTELNDIQKRIAAQLAAVHTTETALKYSNQQLKYANERIVTLKENLVQVKIRANELLITADQDNKAAKQGEIDAFKSSTDESFKKIKKNGEKIVILQTLADSLTAETFTQTAVNRTSIQNNSDNMKALLLEAADISKQVNEAAAAAAAGPPVPEDADEIREDDVLLNDIEEKIKASNQALEAINAGLKVSEEFKDKYKKLEIEALTIVRTFTEASTTAREVDTLLSDVTNQTDLAKLKEGMAGFKNGRNNIFREFRVSFEDRVKLVTNMTSSDLHSGTDFTNVAWVSQKCGDFFIHFQKAVELEKQVESNEKLLLAFSALCKQSAFSAFETNVSKIDISAIDNIQAAHNALDFEIGQLSLKLKTASRRETRKQSQSAHEANFLKIHQEIIDNRLAFNGFISGLKSAKGLQDTLQKELDPSNPTVSVVTRWKALCIDINVMKIFLITMFSSDLTQEKTRLGLIHREFKETDARRLGYWARRTIIALSVYLDDIKKEDCYTALKAKYGDFTALYAILDIGDIASICSPDDTQFVKFISESDYAMGVFEKAHADPSAPNDILTAKINDFKKKLNTEKAQVLTAEENSKVGFYKALDNFMDSMSNTITTEIPFEENLQYEEAFLEHVELLNAYTIISLEVDADTLIKQMPDVKQIALTACKHMIGDTIHLIDLDVKIDRTVDGSVKASLQTESDNLVNQITRHILTLQTDVSTMLVQILLLMCKGIAEEQRLFEELKQISDLLYTKAKAKYEQLTLTNADPAAATQLTEDIKSISRDLDTAKQKWNDEYDKMLNYIQKVVNASLWIQCPEDIVIKTLIQDDTEFSTFLDACTEHDTAHTITDPKDLTLSQAISVLSQAPHFSHTPDVTLQFKQQLLQMIDNRRRTPYNPDSLLTFATPIMAVTETDAERQARLQAESEAEQRQAKLQALVNKASIAEASAKTAKDNRLVGPAESAATDAETAASEAETQSPGSEGAATARTHATNARRSATETKVAFESDQKEAERLKKQEEEDAAKVLTDGAAAAAATLSREEKALADKRKEADEAEAAIKLKASEALAEVKRKADEKEAADNLLATTASATEAKTLSDAERQIEEAAALALSGIAPVVTSTPDASLATAVTDADTVVTTAKAAADAAALLVSDAKAADALKAKRTEEADKKTKAEAAAAAAASAAAAAATAAAAAAAALAAAATAASVSASDTAKLAAAESSKSALSAQVKALEAEVVELNGKNAADLAFYTSAQATSAQNHADEEQKFSSEKAAFTLQVAEHVKSIAIAASALAAEKLERLNDASAAAIREKTLEVERDKHKKLFEAKHKALELLLVAHTASTVLVNKLTGEKSVLEASNVALEAEKGTDKAVILQMGADFAAKTSELLQKNSDYTILEGQKSAKEAELVKSQSEVAKLTTSNVAVIQLKNTAETSLLTLGAEITRLNAEAVSEANRKVVEIENAKIAAVAAHVAAHPLVAAAPVPAILPAAGFVADADFKQLNKDLEIFVNSVATYSSGTTPSAFTYDAAKNKQLEAFVPRLATEAQTMPSSDLRDRLAYTGMIMRTLVHSYGVLLSMPGSDAVALVAKQKTYIADLQSWGQTMQKIASQHYGPSKKVSEFYGGFYELEQPSVKQNTTAMPAI